MHSASDKLVEMRSVVKRYPLFTLEHLDLTLPKGQIMGLVGPNGAGKSTILKLLVGFVKADEGVIRVLGLDIPREQIAVKQQVAYVSEEMRLFGEQTIEWHFQLVARFFSSWDPAYAAHIAARFDLNTRQTVKTLSLGQRIKTNLVLALARRPRLLILDEPSTGLDPVARYELTAELFELMLDEDNSVLFSSQFTQDVERLSDSIAFIDNGQLISCCDKETYMDQWKRIEISPTPTGALPQGLYCEQQGASSASLIDTAFQQDRLTQLKQAGMQVRQVCNLTLEEIFIQQVLIRRQHKAGTQ